MVFSIVFVIKIAFDKAYGINLRKTMWRTHKSCCALHSSIPNTIKTNKITQIKTYIQNETPKRKIGMNAQIHKINEPGSNETRFQSQNKPYK